MEPPPDGVARSSDDLPRRGSHGVAYVGNDEDAQVVRPDSQPAAVSRLAAKRGGADGQHEAADLPSLAPQGAANAGFHFVPHPARELAILR
jgi:hypothetical protein